MPDVCSCGTQLVDGALFCHRCGKPVRDLLPQEAREEAAELPAVEPVGAVAPLAQTVPVSFNNVVAVRIGLLAASVASMLDAVPILNSLFVIWSAGAGFAAVWLYRRSTGQTLSVGSGARLGWITGLLNSVIVIVLLTLSLAASATEITTAMHDRLKATIAQDPVKFAQFKPFMDSPYPIVLGVLMMGVLIFIIFTIACMAGGALGARFTRKVSPPA